ncbi:alanine racemase [Gordonia neofelifaecis]|uniref:Alanine racemase domain-containing protein n=1 Tax=Gordonia neofelifaecis NRRL B-59395 TaxID=644548 RepID=F1YLU5_9ACTN|nr:alanine racemase [Gordonia neofelifaecis]EGD54196.1 alanine racemase domain-containing protein [Gordonia neofelifaecis NRRL B-59395]
MPPTDNPYVTDPAEYWGGIDDAVRRAGLDSPVLALDLGALEHNVADLRARAGGVPIRVASKSLRVRSVIDDILQRDGFAGVLAYDVAEAHWLATESGVTDVLLGYPTVKRAALAALLADSTACERVTLLIDDPAQLDIVDAVVAPERRPVVRIAIDLDASLRAVAGHVHVGVRRSPVHSVEQAQRLARTVAARKGFRLVGAMSYEAQVAGVGNEVAGKFLMNTAVQTMQTVSMVELRHRRGKAIAALREVADLEFVNAGGTGSLEETAKDGAVTDIAAGSGFFGGHLFDTYKHFQPAPALSFGLDVLRRPDHEIVTCAGGGWIASGPPAADRLPKPVWPSGLQFIGTEAAGEVQTPLRGAAAATLAIGDRVWFRHTKSGEVCERSESVALIERGADGRAEVVDVVPTYRGEGKCFL